jgi:DNA polymerase I-like protein with 3'-5' exonuclease and polymerase domains
MCELFYKEWGLPVQRQKRDQQTSITTNALACINLREVVQTGIGGRKDAAWRKDPRCTPRLFDLLLNMKKCSTNLKTFAKVLTDERGRIYPKYVPEAKDVENRGNKTRKGSAATGRLASRDPNFQNQPKVARFSFIPDHPDFCFVQADYIAAELHVMAAVADDHVLYADLTGEESIHTINARDIGCERRTAKAVIFGTAYGSGPKNISDTIKKDDQVYVPVSEVKAVQQAMAEKYWKTWAWRETIRQQVVTHKFIINDFNRIRFFYAGSRDVPAAYDYIPQSTVADILWYVLKPVAMAIRALGGRMTATVHDSILVQVHKSKVEEAMQVMREIMERKFDNIKPGFSIPVSFEVGAPGVSWGELEEQELQEAA